MLRMDTNSPEHAAFLGALKGLPEAVREELWRVRGAVTAEGFAEAERRVHQAHRDMADHAVGLAMIARVHDRAFVEECRAEVHALATAGGVTLNSRGWRPTSVRLLGGSHVQMSALLLSPATPKDPALRRKPGGRGLSRGLPVQR